MDAAPFTQAPLSKMAKCEPPAAPQYTPQITGAAKRMESSLAWISPPGSGTPRSSLPTSSSVPRALSCTSWRAYWTSVKRACPVTTCRITPARNPAMTMAISSSTRVKPAAECRGA
jgi:hypothetical protein